MTHKIHYYAGLIMAFFIGLHLLNHSMILISEETYISFMDFARKIYRNPVSETILLLAVIVQVVSGIKLFRKKWPNRPGLFDKLQLFSGLYFAYFLITHTAAVFAGRYYFELDTNLYFGASVVNMYPVLLFYMFHYGLAIFAFFAHIGSLHYIRIQKYVSEKSARIHGYIFLTVGVLLAILIVGKLMTVDVPAEYIEVYEGIFY
jgi:succinate dehydrogenase/fumarate reductase cytochrome b subunit